MVNSSIVSKALSDRNQSDHCTNLLPTRSPSLSDNLYCYEIYVYLYFSVRTDIYTCTRVVYVRGIESRAMCPLELHRITRFVACSYLKRRELSLLCSLDFIRCVIDIRNSRRCISERHGVSTRFYDTTFVFRCRLSYN